MVPTGHSLGGAIADAAAFQLPHQQIHPTMTFSSVTFDSPGVPEVAWQFVAEESPNSLSERMVCYLASPNPINTLCRHPGRVFHVMVDSLPTTVGQALMYIGLDAAR